jgi:hypothetical protein
MPDALGLALELADGPLDGQAALPGLEQTALVAFTR